jgi:hypothetical protein
MTSNTLHNDLVPIGDTINPDWNRNFREGQDKRTKVIEKILDIEFGEYIHSQNTMLLDVYFTKYWSWGNYCLVYKIKGRYNNVGVLIGTILESTDSVLRWYDLTTNFNFNIYVVTPYETFRFTYLDLLYEYVTMSDARYPSMSVLLETHPRIRQMKEWVIRNPRYERVTKKTVLSHHPYSGFDRSGEKGEFLQLRNDVDSWKREPMNQYRIEGIRPGYYDNSIRGDFNQYINSRLQREIPEEEPIEVKVGLIKRLLKKLKL